MKKSNIKIITTFSLVVALILSFSLPAFATAVYDCDEMGHAWLLDQNGEYILNEYGEKICAACGEGNESGAADKFGTSEDETSIVLPIGGGFVVTGTLLVIGLIVGGLLLLPVFILLLPIFILLLPVLILLAPVFGIIGLIISTVFMA